MALKRPKQKAGAKKKRQQAAATAPKLAAPVKEAEDEESEDDDLEALEGHPCALEAMFDNEVRTLLLTRSSDPSLLALPRCQQYPSHLSPILGSSVG